MLLDTLCNTEWVGVVCACSA